MNLSFILKLALIMIMSILTCAWPCLSNNVTISCNGEERKGLMKFKQSLQDPYNLLSSWKGNDCCRWSGVTCNMVTGRVIKLELQETWVSNLIWVGPRMFSSHYRDQKVKPFATGDLNSGLVSLRYLSHLDLSGVWYTKTTVVPEFFASMKWLRHLRLLSEGYHSCIYDCDDIKDPLDCYVDASFFCEYSYGGLEVDDVHWLFHLQTLESLEMSGVNLPRPFEFIRVVNQLPSLLVLGLSNCELENSHLFHFNSTFLARLQYLDLSKNYILSCIPRAFGNMTSLQYLDLSGNNFSSFNPAWFSSTKSLTYIDLSNNEIDKVAEMVLSLLENNQRLKSLILGDLSGPTWSLRDNSSFITGDNSTKSIGVDMELLDLTFCNIAGAFPSWFRNMRKLRYLRLSKNFFAGSVPKLPNLKELDLSFNDLDDVNLTSLGRLPRLESLRLSNNMLKGNILQLLPDSMETVNLKMLDLSSNQLQGEIPTTISNLRALKMLDLSSNQLQGTIPTTTCNLRALESLYLDSNRLTGSIPISLGILTNLKIMSLSNNSLEGTIPESLGGLSSLRFLNISANRLSGRIPKTMGQLANLVDLFLHGNSLDGMVSEAHFSNLSKLEVLNIGLSNLTFNVSLNWVPPFQLKYIYLGSCKFESKFPNWIKTQKKTHTLLLSNAHILGPIPRWFKSMQFSRVDLSNNRITGHLSNFPPSLKYLDLSNNSIFEHLPPNISTVIPSVSALYLRGNFISGPLPASLCNMTNLSELDLSGNNFAGEIPDCWNKTSFFYLINLSSNKLSGSIPKSMGQLSVISLHLNNNSLYGQLPEDLRNCTVLVILDVGENNLSGKLPTWIGTNLMFLQILRLRGNKFSGRIPKQFCSLDLLRILDLGFNNLTGKIPSCLLHSGGMKSDDGLANQAEPRVRPRNFNKEHVIEILKGRDLEYTRNIQFLVNLDLSSNYLVGSIPEELFSLSGLLGLNLSHNNLSGSISNNIKGMTSLESLDLSNNKLTGTIPQGISSLFALSHLNLANNNFSGQVPQGNQLQTIYADDPSIYDGNPLLCGNPLPRKCNEAEAPRAGRTKPLKGSKELITDKAILVIITAFGYAVGFWGVILVLIFKKSWRIAYFRFADETFNKVYVAIAVKLAKIHGRW